MDNKTRIGLIILLFTAGCATNKFAYNPQYILPSTKNIKLSVGQFENKTGYGDPNQISWNVWFDIPLSDAVRKAVTSELKQAGYIIGESDYEVGGMVHSIVYGPNDEFVPTGTSLTFQIKRISDKEIIYQKKFFEGSEGLFIWDSKGQINHLKECIIQFINDLNIHENMVAASRIKNERY